MFTSDVLTLNRPTAVLTDRGVAVNAVYRLRAALRALPVDDRADVVMLLAEELRDVIRGLAESPA